MINGRVFDWESIRVDLPAGLDFEIQSITYSHEATVEAVYGRGNAARGYGVGNLEQSGNMVVNHRSWLAFTVFAATQGGFHRINPFPITVSYANDDQTPQIDVLRDVKPIKSETEANQGDTEIKLHTIDFIILSPILFEGVPVL